MKQRSCDSGHGKSRSRANVSCRAKISSPAKVSWKSLGLASFHFIESLERRVLLSAAQPYTYENVAIGGGGFVDGVFFSPTQPGVVYARTDIGGLYKSSDDGNTWSELLDFVGNSASNSGNGTNQQMMGVMSFAIDPENASNIYADVGQYSFQNGDVLVSHNGGQTFSITQLPFPVGGNSNGRATGERLAVDPNDSNVLFLGSDDPGGTHTADGLFKSTSSGAVFAKDTTFPTGPGTLGITLVQFSAVGGTPGSPTQTIFAGVNSVSSGTNLYETRNGGQTWSQITGTGQVPSGFIPVRTAEAADGNLYVSYGNSLTPNGLMTSGGLFQYNTSTGVWTNISPVVPGGGDQFGYGGLAQDPGDADTLVVASFDQYGDQDMIWRTTDATDPSPVWTELFDVIPGDYGGGNPTRDTSAAPWVANFDDGIGNWAASVAIDPTSPGHILYTNGQGLWATNDGVTTSTLMASNSWYFPDTGIEFTSAVAEAPNAGLPLLAALGDINGFAFTALNQSPAAGGIAADISGGGAGSFTAVDSAGLDPNDAVVIGSSGNAGGAYSTDDGATWTEFTANPGGGTKFTDGTVAMAADGTTIVWAPSGQVPYYSSDDGTTWTASTGAPLGGKVIADRVNPNFFYYYTENSSDNVWTLYISSNGGHTFAASGAGSLPIGNVTLVANPRAAGDLWFSSYDGLYHSANFGASLPHVGSFSVNAFDIGLGASAPGVSAPAIYIYGTTVSGSNALAGFFRSDDGGNTWTALNTLSQQFGGLVNNIAGDPNVYGRFYAGFNGRGVIMGNPTGVLPANFIDADVNTPGNPGFAYSSTLLSPGTMSKGWVVNGGGAAIGGTSDQFNFAYEPLGGDISITAQLTSLTNSDNGDGVSSAGVMFRAGTAADAPFVAIMQDSAGELVMESRSTEGGSVSATTLADVAVGAEFLQVVRTGNSFTASASSNGTNFTALGPNVTIAAMPDTADVGFAVTSGYDPQLATAKFAQTAITTPPPPSITSGSSAVFTTGRAASFTVAASNPGQTIVFSEIGIEPAGISLVDNGDGTATLGGTPSPLAGGTYKLTLSASNGATTGTQTFALTVLQPGQVTSPASATFIAGKAGVFNVTASAFPGAAMIFESGALPAGITLSTSGPLGAQLHGTPAAGTGGTYNLQLYAVNGAGPLAPQSFTLVVDQQPVFKSAAAAVIFAGSAQTLNILASGVGPAALTLSSAAVVPGMTFTDLGGGAATLAGTPTTGGTYHFTTAAANGTTNINQVFSVVVDQAPVFTTGNTVTFTTGALGTFGINTTGYPTATTFLETGMLPMGVTLTAMGAQKAQLHGVPAAGSGGTYSIVLYAHNGVGPVAQEAFMLIVDQAPVFTSAGQATLVAGTTASFAVTASGVGTTVAYAETGALPAGVSFADNGDGTAGLSGTPSVGGVFKFTITATNGTTPTKQVFTLTSDEAATFSSAATATFTAGKLNTFNVTSTAFPAATNYFALGQLPTGVTLVALGTTSAQLKGTPALSSVGTYTVTLAANNTVAPVAEQMFTLIISPPAAGKGKA